MIVSKTAASEAAEFKILSSEYAEGRCVWHAGQLLHLRLQAHNPTAAASSPGPLAGLGCRC